MWIARDKNNSLWIYDSEPIKIGNSWSTDGVAVSVSDYDEIMFPEVNWEDKEPTEIEITIKKK